MKSKDKLIYFIISSSSVRGLQISGFAENPNIGGTEFVTIQLALELAENEPKFEVRLVTIHPFQINEIPKNLKIVSLKNDFSFKKGSVVILSSKSTPILNSMRTENQRIILWSHHPHDFLIRDAKFQVSELVSIGAYQYESNRLIYGEHSKIQNIPPRVNIKLGTVNRKELRNFIYLGSFAPAKGLSKIIRNFKYLYQINPSFKLNILGGTIYDFDKDTMPPAIKTAYQRLPRSVKNNVCFLGAVEQGKGEIIAKHDLALLNPTGKSEAFPASVLECYYQGIPVIASYDYGMSEFLPIKSPVSIKNGNSAVSAFAYLNEPENYQKECERIYSLVEIYLSKRKNILDAWCRVLNGDKKVHQNKKYFKLNWTMIYRHIKFGCIRLMKKAFS